MGHGVLPVTTFNVKPMEGEAPRETHALFAKERDAVPPPALLVPARLPPVVEWKEEGVSLMCQRVSCSVLEEYMCSESSSATTEEELVRSSVIGVPIIKFHFF